MVGFNTNTVDRVPARQAINTVEIFTENDFPTATGSGPATITLAADTTYLIRAIVTLPDNTVISLDDNTIVQGTNVEVSGIIGDVDAPMIETTGAIGVRFQMRDLAIQNLGNIAAGAESARITQNSSFTGGAELTRVTFRTAPVRIHSGLGVVFSRCGWLGGSSIIQGGDGGTGGLNLAINDLCTFNDQNVSVPNGLLQFAAGNITQTLGLRDTLFILAGAGTIGIVIDESPTFLDSLLFGAPVFVSLFSDHFAFKVENPDDVIRAEIVRTNFSGGGALFSCDPSVSSTKGITISAGFIFGVGISGKGDGKPFPGGNMIVTNDDGVGPGTIQLLDKLGNEEATALVVAFGGSGYSPSDVLTVVGGEFNTAATITVLTVSTGVILTAEITTGGSYNVLPTNDVLTTGAGDSLATFTLTFADLPPLETIAAPNNTVVGVTWHKGDMYSADATDLGFIYQHDGFSVGIDSNSPLTPIPGNVSDITFVGDNLVVCSSVDGLVRVFNNFSLTLLDSFESGFAAAGGITYDGINLIIKDNDSPTVNVMQGVSAVVQYSFEAEITGTSGRGMASIPGNGLLIADITNDVVDIYDHPVTFDHSSRTWQILESPNVTLSSDRGGSAFFSETPVQVDLSSVTAGDWTDIIGPNLFYFPFAQNEKCVLDDEINGELEWLGVRDTGRTLTAQATFNRSTAMGGVRTYQIAVCIDDIPINDSFATAVLEDAQAGDTFVTLTTLPISRDLVAGQRIRIQIRNITDQLDPRVTSSRISIT